MFWFKKDIEDKIEYKTEENSSNSRLHQFGNLIGLGKRDKIDLPEPQVLRTDGWMRTTCYPTELSEKSFITIQYVSTKNNDLITHGYKHKRIVPKDMNLFLSNDKLKRKYKKNMRERKYNRRSIKLRRK